MVSTPDMERMRRTDLVRDIKRVDENLFNLNLYIKKDIVGLKFWVPSRSIYIYENLLVQRIINYPWVFYKKEKDQGSNSVDEVGCVLFRHINLLYNNQVSPSWL